MEKSVFAVEVCLPLDPSLQSALRALVIEHPERSGGHQKWRLYKQASDVILENIDRLDRGCWDYFDDDKRANRDYKMWVAGMTTEEGARTEPSGQSDPYRGTPRYMTLTMAFLLVKDSPSDRAMAKLCNVADGDLWKRATFIRILSGMRELSFASVESDVIYVIPGDSGWGLTTEDLAAEKFEYLRHVQ